MSLYEPQTWTDGPGGGTPVSAARLLHMETGIEALDQGTVKLAGAQTVAGNKTLTGSTVVSHAIGGDLAFNVVVDNGYAHGAKTRFSIENNVGPATESVDLNFRFASVVFGSTDSGQSNLVPIDMSSPVGSTGQYLRIYKPGETSNAVFAVDVAGSVMIRCGGLAGRALGVGIRTDSEFAFTVSEIGTLGWGPGGSTAVDTTLARTAAGVLRMAASGGLQVGKIEADPVASRLHLRGSVGVLAETSDSAGSALEVQGAFNQSVSILKITNSSSAVLSHFDKNGFFMTRKVAAPADGDLASSEVALWLDATSGAAKLKIKAKDSGGTVRTGEVALA